jgi:two-component system, OmpR family, phosphate regulon response regulator PhoB
MRSAVLLVHGEQPLREAARGILELAGHAVQEAHELNSAWRLVETAKPDLIIFPWTSLKPVRDSLLRLREDNATRQSRVIVWAPQADIHEAVNALEFGADDCLAVPFDRAELIARVNACLRRPAASTRPDLLAAGPVVLDKAVHCLLVNESPVDLAPTEFRLMAFFLENQGRVFSRDELLRRAWSKNIKAGHRTVDVHVRRLRQLLEPFGCDGFIQTVRGFGYRFASSSRDARASELARRRDLRSARNEIET